VTPWHVTDQRRSREEIASLTSLRGIAAFWVVLLHLSAVTSEVLPEVGFLGPLFKAGVFAVPLFFVLSGYVLGMRYASELSTPTVRSVFRFWWLRLGRVYPVHACTLAISVVMVSIHGWPSDEAHSLGRFVANCLLIHSWDYHFRLSWNYPSWSISSEWFGYLMFPAMAAMLAGVRRHSTALLLGLACLVSAGVYAFDQHLPFRGLVTALPTIGGGLCLAIVCAPRRLRTRVLPPPELGLVAGAMLPFVVGPGPLQSALYLLLFYGLVGVLGVTGNRATALWQSGPVVYLGEISYSLYMTHAITITLLTRFFPFHVVDGFPLLVRAIVLFCCVAAVLGVSAIMYYTVERPMRRLSRQLKDGFGHKLS
jgi:peptidoglycan/LPS O-acetylase OafA/YrhL